MSQDQTIKESQPGQSTIFKDKDVDTIEEPDYVGFFRRFFAYIIDFMIVLLITGFLNFDSIFTYFIFYTFYNTLLHASPLQGTIGKLLVGAIVTDVYGEKLNLGRSFLRALSIYISAFILGIGFIMVALNHENKALHDHMAGSMVINKS